MQSYHAVLEAPPAPDRRQLRRQLRRVLGYALNDPWCARAVAAQLRKGDTQGHKVLNALKVFEALVNSAPADTGNALRDDGLSLYEKVCVLQGVLQTLPFLRVLR